MWKTCCTVLPMKLLCIGSAPKSFNQREWGQPSETHPLLNVPLYQLVQSLSSYIAVAKWIQNMKDTKQNSSVIWRVRSWMNLHMHKKVAGSGFHIPFDAQIDVMFPAGTYDVLQLKNISEPCCVPWEISRDWTEPFSGREGAPQPTGEENRPVITNIVATLCSKFVQSNNKMNDIQLAM